MSDAIISIEDARRVVLDACRRLEAEAVSLERALGRALAQDVVAAGDVPPYAGSAMDGFAILAGPAGRHLAIVAESSAGHPADAAVAEGLAIRISTGAAVPDGATAVVRVEDTSEADGQVAVHAATEPGQNLREAGEDVRAGTTVLRAGAELGPAELGVAAGAGVAALLCVRRPRVAVLATGDELVAPGQPLRHGQLHDSNALTLDALATRAGADVVVRGAVADHPAATAEALDGALTAADVVVVSGGVSVGPHDHVKPALAELGVRESFWRVALQPGKPTWFGTRADRLVFGLPGNPVSAMVTFLLFARPALRALQGLNPLPAREPATLARPARRRHDREQALRVRLEPSPEGLRAVTTGSQGSHILTSMLGADALAFVPPGEGDLAVGDAVEVERIG
ncbi:MAG: molybdopterin molybdotransferase MoeA [Solirubrobacteraceae bacterium]